MSDTTTDTADSKPLLRKLEAKLLMFLVMVAVTVTFVLLKYITEQKIIAELLTNLFGIFSLAFAGQTVGEALAKKGSAP